MHCYGLSHQRISGGWTCFSIVYIRSPRQSQQPIIKFSNKYLQDLYENKKVGGKPKFSDVVIKKFRQKIQILNYAESSQQIYSFKGLHFEKLSGDLSGYYSCRVDIQYRIILSIEIDAILVQEIILIEDLTNHYD